MKAEEKYILQILSDFVFERPSDEPAEDIDWTALYEIASNHEIGGIVFKQCKSFIPDYAFHSFESAYSATMFFHSNRYNMRSSVLKVLTEKNIPHFTVKGTNIANYYPVPALRTSGDIDLVVHAEDRDEVYDILVNLGFKPPYKKRTTEWTFWKNNIELELHKALAYDKSLYSTNQYKFLCNCWNYVENDVLDINFHFIFLIFHMYKHFKGAGIGIRLFLDIAIIANNSKNLDFDFIEKNLTGIELFDFAKTVTTINERWFGVKSPFDPVQISDEFFEESTKYIFNNGVFGKQNTDTTANMAISRMIAGRSKFSILMNHLFPPYSLLITNNNFKWLEGKKYLLPVAWSKKYINVLFKKNIKNSYKSLAAKNINKEEYQQRVDFLNDWGIDTDAIGKKADDNI